MKSLIKITLMLEAINQQNNKKEKRQKNKQ